MLLGFPPHQCKFCICLGSLKGEDPLVESHHSFCKRYNKKKHSKLHVGNIEEGKETNNRIPCYFNISEYIYIYTVYTHVTQMHTHSIFLF